MRLNFGLASLTRGYGKPSWIVAQRWENLLFAHWPVPESLLRPLLPSGLPLDTYEGQAWLGVVPFQMAGIHGRGLPPLPGLSALPELNVRTYVTLGGRPGVYFLSLDAASPAAVLFGRRVYHLPYYTADISVHGDGSPSLPGGGDPGRSGVAYACRRRQHDGEPVEFRACYRPVGPACYAETGSLEDWLTARFCLYAAGRRGSLYRAGVQHAPWKLQPAEAVIKVNTMAAPHGLPLSGAPLLHFSRRTAVHIGPPRRVSHRVYRV